MSFVSTLLALLVASAPAPARAGEPAAPPAEPSEYTWTATIEVGAGFLLLDDSPFGRTLDDFGYTLDAVGWALLVAVDRQVLPWLAVGGTAAATLHSGAREDRGAATETSFTRLTARVHARASLCMAPRCVRDEAATFGLQLAAGGGATLWALRGETESAPHLSLEASLHWSVLLGHWGFGLRLGHALVVDGELGPTGTGPGATWSPTLALQVYYRW